MKVFTHRISERVGFKASFGWCLLAFSAGVVNSGGYLACQRFVSHVTGFATLAGVEAARSSWIQTLQMMTVPVYFLMGVMISAYLVERRSRKGLQPLYSVAMILAGGALLIASLGGLAGWFGIFGFDSSAAGNSTESYALLALLCGASGLQNAALTSSSGATVRTTHLTGVTTDLGLGLVRAISLSPGDPQRTSEAFANTLRFATIASFMTGSGIGALLFLRIHYAGFLLPSVIMFYAAVVALLEEKKERRRA